MEQERRNQAPGLVWQATSAGFVVALCQGTPHQVELSSIVAWARRAHLRARGVLIEDLRGGLDAARSDWLDRLSGMLKAPVALLSDSALARSAAACHLLGERVYGYRCRDFEAALDRLDANPGERVTLEAALLALKVARRLESRTTERHGRSLGPRRHATASTP